MNRFIYILIAGLFAGFATIAQPLQDKAGFRVGVDTLKWYDQIRHREVPVAIYKTKSNKIIRDQQLVIISHGYAENNGRAYLGYTYLTMYLASRGYFVVSIQHELRTDSLIPLTGIPQIVRRPFWDRGADNILFVINQLKKYYPGINYKRITLIGHSNGGDMSALFPQKYPNIIHKVITLDNRRMALPRTKEPMVYSLRSSDQPADEGVLPSDEEIRNFGMKIIRLPNTAHNDMSDNANDAQRKEIQNFIMTFLKE